MRVRQGISTLLDLNGQIIDQENGYWIKIDAWEVDRSREIPHGVRYSLSLHEPSGKRILGYDNAHAVKPPKNSNMQERDCLLITNTSIVRTKGCLTNLKAPISYSRIFSVKWIGLCKR